MAIAEKAQLKKNFSEPDERTDLPNSKIEVLGLGGRQMTKVTMFPGWRWSKDVKPSVGTELCEVEHIGYQVKGRMHIFLRDGMEYDVEPDSFFIIPAGHDGSVVGNEPAEMVAFTGDTIWQLKK